jgi:hypothetical protein
MIGSGLLGRCSFKRGEAEALYAKSEKRLAKRRGGEKPGVEARYAARRVRAREARVTALRCKYAQV